MPPALRANLIETLVGQLADLLSAQAADLHEYARATSMEEGTIQLERNLRVLELRRAELYHQFEEAAFTVTPAPAVNALRQLVRDGVES
jgi:hypothetical protein